MGTTHRFVCHLGWIKPWKSDRVLSEDAVAKKYEIKWDKTTGLLTGVLYNHDWDYDDLNLIRSLIRKICDMNYVKNWSPLYLVLFMDDEEIKIVQIYFPHIKNKSIEELTAE